MGTIFFIPLILIAFYESAFDKRKHTWMNNWFRGNDEGATDEIANRDPGVDDPACNGLVISKVPFEELVKVFPNTAQSTEASIVKEIDDVKKQLKALLKQLESIQT
jgi:hypothetical protein